MKAIKKVFFLFRLMYKVSPSYSFIIAFGSLFTSFQVFGNVVLPKYLIEELLGERNIQKLLLLGGGIVALNLIFGVLVKTYRRLLDVKNEYVNRHITALMAKKIMDVEYQYLEDPYYLDLKERAVFACNNQSALLNIINHLSGFFASVITLIGLTVIMFTLSYVLVLILLIGIAITLWLSQYFRKLQVRFYHGILPLNRRYGYFLNQSFDPRISKDMRLFNISPLLLERVQRFNRSINDEFKKFAKRQGLTYGIRRIISAIQSGLVYGYVTLRAISNRFGRQITLGDFTMYVASAIQFAVTFDMILTQITTVIQMIDYLDPLVEFMQLKEAEKSPGTVILETIESIEFRDVTFTYPKSDQKVLDQVSFKFSKGDKISIVGLNGAGKTTLVKLLCRLYQPQNGTILVNNLDINAYDYTSYIAQIAAVFQDYRLFAYTIRENIENEITRDVNSLESIIKQVGLEDKIQELPKGFDTRLNKTYDPDGVELSGGQMQKIAIARALYKNASLIILDEPTSALDPLAEADIYQNFNDLVLDKTAIYISHRMSSSVFCDRVLILNKGIVDDFDTHKNLMKKKNTLYFKLFQSQADHYQL